MRKLSLYLGVVLAVCAAYLFPKLSGLYFIILLFAAIVSILAKKADERDRRFLITMIFLIFLSRFILSLFVMNARGEALTQDEGLYSKKALLKIYEIKGGQNLERLFYEYFDNDYDMLHKDYGYNAYTYLLSCFYYVFGYQIQAARCINIFINILTFILIFYLTRALFDSRLAKICSAVYAFFPSITLWSVMIGVDTLAIFGVLLYVFFLVKIIKKFSLRWIILMATSLFAAGWLRSHVISALILSTFIVVLVKVAGMLSKRGRLAFLALLVLFIVMTINLPIIPFAKEKIKGLQQYVVERQMAFAVGDDSGYFIFPEHCYITETFGMHDFFKAYLKGMYYVLFSPFPWKIESKSQLMAYPQVILWYFMMPFILYGFCTGFRKNKLAALSILLYSFIMFSTFALISGNIGALFRHKDMVTPFFIIYASYGVYRLAGGRVNIRTREAP